MTKFEKGTEVVSRDGVHVGHTTGGSKPCTLEGCLGVRVRVRWDDGAITYPCSKGMEKTDTGYKVL